MHTFKSLFVVCTALVWASLLFACGGSSDFPPVISGIKPQSVSYGRMATIYLGGKDLRSSLVVESNGACTNPSFATTSTTDLLVLNCGVKVVGDIPLTIKKTAGEVVYTTTITLPKPRHWSRSVKLSGHDRWNTQKGAAIRSIPKTGWDAISKPFDTLLPASCFEKL